MDTKVQANGNLDIWWIPVSGVANYKAPTAAEINAGVRLTPAIAWEGTTFPNASESNDIDDRTLEDLGNAVQAGFQQFEAELNLFHSGDLSDTTSDFTIAFETFRTARITGYLVTRVLQRATAPATTPATAGDIISVFKFMVDYTSDDTTQEAGYKYAVGTLPQGEVAVHTQVKTATPVAVLPTTASVAVGAFTTARATLGGWDVTQGAEWRSSDTTVATVSPNGVIKGISAGTANITANRDAATGPGTVAVTVA